MIPIVFIILKTEKKRVKLTETTSKNPSEHCLAITILNYQLEAGPL